MFLYLAYMSYNYEEYKKCNLCEERHELISKRVFQSVKYVLGELYEYGLLGMLVFVCKDFSDYTLYIDFRECN